MLLYISEILKRLEITISSIFIILIYVYFIIEDIYTFMNVYLYANDYSFYIEYNFKVNMIEYINNKLDDKYDTDLYFDYQLVTNNIKNNENITFVSIISIIVCAIFIYEAYIYFKAILYKEEQFVIYCKIYILFMIMWFDLVFINYLTLCHIHADNAMIYQSLEILTINNANYINYFIYTLIFNACIIKMLDNQYYNYVYAFYTVLYIYLCSIEIQILIFMLLKYLIVIEWHIIIVIYIAKLHKK